MLESVTLFGPGGPSVWIREPLPGGWVAAYHFALQEGVPVLTSLRVYAPAQVAALRAEGESLGNGEVDDVGGDEVPAGGLTSRTLRSLRPTAALGRVLAQPRRPTSGGDIFDAFAMGEWRELVAKYDQTGATEPRSRLHRLARVAQLYAAGVAERHPNINVTIAEKLGRSPSQVRDDVYAARQEGLLTQGGGHGRTAGQLTQKAREILEDTG